jgi:hypothetical protein
MHALRIVARGDKEDGTVEELKGVRLKMHPGSQFHVLLDANIWVAERLLQSSLGSALLYTLTRAKASIVLPEVVELEVNRVLPDLAEKAVAVIGREASLLRQLSGHNLLFTGPSALSIADGMKDRWQKLDGLLLRVPFTYEQARSALNRVLKKSPPSGDNNEQFRDCCIWDAALGAASDRPVHLISADSAFYENRNRSSGLATALREELRSTKRDIGIYPGLKEFLTAIGDSTSTIDEEAIGLAIVQSVTPRAREIATEKNAFELGAAHKPKIKGYATPKPTLIAVSFEVAFDLKFVEDRGRLEEHDEAELKLKGVCSYDPNDKRISEVEVREWSTSLRGHHGGFSERISPDRTAVDRQYGPSRTRIIS